MSLGLLGWTDGCKIFRAPKTSYLVLFALILNHLLSTKTSVKLFIGNMEGNNLQLLLIFSLKVEKNNTTQKDLIVDPDKSEKM